MSIPDPLLKHRREVRYKIILPVLLPAILLIVMGGIMVGLVISDRLTHQQVGVVSACVGTLCVFLPLALVFFVFDYLMLLMAFGSGKLGGLLTMPFSLGRDYSSRGAALAHSYSEKIGTFVINLRVRLTRWRYIILAWLNGSEANDE